MSSHHTSSLPGAAAVVSVCALLAAASTASYAAGLAKGSVGTAQLRRGAVTQVKIGAGAVTAPKLGRAAVTSRAVEDGTIGAADLAPDVLPPRTRTVQADLFDNQAVTLLTAGDLTYRAFCQGPGGVDGYRRGGFVISPVVSKGDPQTVAATLVVVKTTGAEQTTVTTAVPSGDLDAVSSEVYGRSGEEGHLVLSGSVSRGRVRAGSVDLSMSVSGLSGSTCRVDGTIDPGRP